MVKSTPFNMKVISATINYLNEVKLEMLKVTWPTRDQTMKMVLLVLIVSVVTGAFLGAWDYLLSRIIGAVLNR